MSIKKPKPGITTQIPIKDLKPDPDQPRKTYDGASLKAFAENIKEHGVIQPIIVRWSDNAPMIVHGERRWRAAKLAGLKSVPCLLEEGDEDAIGRGARQVAENTERESLAPLDVAEFLDNLRQKEGKTHNELVKALQDRGFTEAGHMKVRQLLDLVLLPDWAKKHLRDEKLSVTAAHSIIPILKEPEVLADVKAEIEQGIRYRDAVTASEIKHWISWKRSAIKREAEEQERQQRQIAIQQKAEQRKAEGKLSAEEQRQERERTSSLNRRKEEIKAEKLEQYLDNWLRPRILELAPRALMPGWLKALALWMACGAPEDKPSRHGAVFIGRNTHEGTAATHAQEFMVKHKLADLNTFLDMGADVRTDHWQDMARAAVKTMTKEQLRCFAHFLQLDLAKMGYVMDIDVLNILRKKDLLALAKLAQFESAAGTLKSLKQRLLAPEVIQVIGVPAELEKIYRKAPKVKELPDVDLESVVGDPPTAEELEALAGTAAANAEASTGERPAKKAAKKRGR